ANGSLQILDLAGGKQYQIDPPDQIATAILKVPSAGPADCWDMEGVFIDAGAPIGAVHLTHWYTNDFHRVLGFISPGVIFWTVLAAGTLLVLMAWRRRQADSISIAPH